MFVMKYVGEWVISGSGGGNEDVIIEFGKVGWMMYGLFEEWLEGCY